MGRWNTVYPIYFDAKVSVNNGRRVKREDAMWWPQARQISLACSALALRCVLEVSSDRGCNYASGSLLIF